MGGSSSTPSQQQIQTYEAKLQWYHETLAAVEEHERQEWKKVTPGTPRLMLYWIQMLLCVLESLPRIAFHAIGWLIAAVWLLLALGLQHLAAKIRNCASFLLGKFEENAEGELDQQRPKQQKNELLAARQLQQQQWRLQVYVRIMPDVLFDNLKNPWTPYFADGVEVAIHRPDRPKHPAGNSGGSFLDCFDCSCSCDCFEHFQEMEIRFFRSNFFALSGCSSFQCGSCLGPCVTPCCYSPCAGGDVESGHCKACEPEQVRLARWLREAAERKKERTALFFSMRPDLMRPRRQLVGNALDALPPQEGPTAPLLARPAQQALLSS